MPPAQVGVVKVELERARDGRIAGVPGSRAHGPGACSRAGILQKRQFTEGADVKAGESLFQIDSATHQAALESARPPRPRLKRTWRRPPLWSSATSLARPPRPSAQEFLNAQVAQRQAQADVAAAKAAVQTARINLGYVLRRGAHFGRIGRAMVTEGPCGAG